MIPSTLRTYFTNTTTIVTFAHRCDLDNCMQLLKSQFGVRSVLVEGGAGVIQSVLERGLADQVVLTFHPGYFGGYRCMTRQLQSMESLHSINVASVGGDVVVYGQLAHSAVSSRTARQTTPQNLSAPRSAVNLIRNSINPIYKVWVALSVCNVLVTVLHVLKGIYPYLYPKS